MHGLRLGSGECHWVAHAIRCRVADAALGAIDLTVADVDRARTFYEQTIGLKALERSADVVRLGADGAAVVELTSDPAAPARPRGTTGLFHLAILLASRVELARALRRIADSGWRLGGASDHLVSEALYLSDPEGNGIEIYRDRPREEWPFEDGKLQMATLPLDVEGLLGELEHAEGAPNGIGAQTRLGHVHLQVAELDAAARFYRDLLGFEVTVEHYPGALFLSYGGYHHHIGLNTWESDRRGVGARRRAAARRGR